MKTRFRLPCSGGLLGAVLAFSPPPAAQAATSVPAPSGAGNAETVTLTPFEVRDSTAQGYAAAVASSGTRYASSIKEIPFPVNVITSDFLNDIVAETLDDAVAYTSSFTPTDGNFKLRGMLGSDSYKNGLREGGRMAGVFSTTAVDRIEIIKGSNAAIYGATSPVGLTNVVTKKATANPMQNLRLDVGTGKFKNVRADVNQPIVGDKLMTRFSFSLKNNQISGSDFWQSRERVLYNSTTWRIAPRLALTLNAEWIDRTTRGGDRRLPYASAIVTLNNIPTRVFVGHLGEGYLSHFRRLNVSGPKGFTNLDSRQLDTQLSYALNDIFSFRVNAGHWQRLQKQLVTTVNYNGSNTATSYDVPSNTLMGPAFENRRQRIREFQYNAQADLLARFSTGPVKHHFLITNDFGRYDQAILTRLSRGRPDSQDVTPNSIFRGTRVVSPTFPYEADISDHAVWNLVQANSKLRQLTRGLMLSERATFWQDRVVAMIGTRRDRVQNDQYSFTGATTFNGVVYPIGARIPYPIARANTLQSGLGFAITPQLSAYANYAESFTPNDPQARDKDNNLLPNLEGEGREFGFKADFLSGRLTFTLGRFEITKSNTPRRALDQAGNRLTLPGTTLEYQTFATISSEGYELDAHWRIADAWEILGGAGWNKAHYSHVPNPTEQWLKGLPPDSTPKWTGGVNVVFRPRTFLKGLNARIGVRYQGRMTLSTDQSSPFGTSGIKGNPLVVGGRTFDTYFFSSKALFLVDSGVSYRWATRNGKYRHSAGVTIKNALDQDYLRSRRVGDPRSAIFSYEISH